MAEIKDFVSVTITRSTSAITRASFEIPCWLDVHAAFAERARVYTSIEGVADDFDVNSSTYKRLQTMFSQELPPQQVVVGRKASNGATLSFPTVTANTAYSFTVNGQVITFTSDASPLASEIATGLKAAFDAANPAIVGVTATPSGNTLVLAATGSWSLKPGSGVEAAYTATAETWVDALNAVKLENNGFIALMASTHTTADQLALAAAIQADEKLYFTSTQDSTAKALTTTDIGAQAAALEYDQTVVMWSANADTEYPEVALGSYFIQFVPGSATAMYKSLTGITPDKLTATEEANLLGKNYNVYTTVAGVSIIYNGRVAEGSPIDLMLTVLWTIVRMRERLYFRLTNTLKIPMTRTGATMIEAEILSVFNEGVANGAFTRDVQPIVVVPDPQTLDPNLRAQGIWENITFDFRFARAVERIRIRGNISI